MYMYLDNLYLTRSDRNESHILVVKNQILDECGEGFVQ